MTHLLTHLWYWLRRCPLWYDDHTYTGIAGSGEYYCLVCGKREEVEDE